MFNWYRNIKIARRGTDLSLMDQYTSFNGDELNSEPEAITAPNPIWGGNERTTSDGKGYPKGVSSLEDPQEEDDGTKSLPVDRTLLDDEIPIGEGVNKEQFVDEVDEPGKMKNPDPIGPHNMNGKTLFREVSKKIRLKNLNKI